MCSIAKGLKPLGLSISFIIICSPNLLFQNKRTMRNKTIAILFLLLSPGILFCQYKDLKKDKSITWIAEFEMDLSFDLQQSGDNTNELTLKKFIPPKGAAQGAGGDWLTRSLYHHIVKGEVLSYKTSALDRPYTIDEILRMVASVDTVITFNPETFEETIVVVKNDLDPDDIKTCRTRQAMYFDKTDGTFHTRLVAIAPLLEISDVNGNPVKKKPLAWVRMEDVFGHKINEKNKAIAWAATIYTRATPLQFSQLKVVKGNLDLRRQLYDTALKGQRPIERMTSPGKGAALSKKDIQSIYNSVDTVITFDPQTYVETVQVIKNDYKYSDVNACRLVQDWYYLPEKRMIVNRLRSIVPIVGVKDDKGNFKYWKALYAIEY